MWTSLNLCPCRALWTVTQLSSLHLDNVTNDIISLTMKIFTCAGTLWRASSVDVHRHCAFCCVPLIPSKVMHAVTWQAEHEHLHALCR